MAYCDYLKKEGWLSETFYCQSDKHPNYDKNYKKAKLSEQTGRVPLRCGGADFENCPHYISKSRNTSANTKCPFCGKALAKASIDNGRCGECGKYI